MPSRDAFLAESVVTLRREIPEDLEWVPWRKLPAMHWQDDGASVDERIPRGWLVAAAARGRPRPDAELQTRASMFDRGDALALGNWLLRAWIEHDTVVPELTETRKAELRAIAERAAEMARRFGRGGTDPEERYLQLLAQEGGRPASSSLPHQGLLAVVAACADASVAGDVERYLDEWRGERPRRCRALLEMLSSIDAAAAARLG